MLSNGGCVARAVVIGGSGFIGSHLVDALVRAGHEVTAFDRFSGDHILFSERASILRGDFLSHSDLEAAVEGQDLVFHFLSTTTPATAENDPTFDIRTNLIQTVELLESAVRARVKHVYFASTGGAIYGMQGKGEYSETDRAMPISPYGIGKLTIEHYLRYFAVKHSLASTTFRISNPYGTRQHANRKQGLIPIALRDIALGRPVTRFGDGSMVRDFIYVNDVVEMITRMVGHETRHDLYNLGSGCGYTVNEIFASLRRVTGIDFAIDARPTPPTFVDRVVLNVDRYTDEFGAASLTGLDEGVRATYEEIRRQLHE